jgi:hypothetical protein
LLEQPIQMTQARMMRSNRFRRLQQWRQHAAPVGKFNQRREPAMWIMLRSFCKIVRFQLVRLDRELVPQRSD